MAITKAVIPAAGLGTRMLPAAKAVPKELLPVLDRPVIQYIVEEAADAGICDVLLVTSRDKPSLLEHFRRNELLEERLGAGGKSALLAELNKLISRVAIHGVDQPQQRGLGDAVRLAREHVGDEPFLCLLGDTIFSGDPPAQQLLEAHRELGGAVIGLEEVEPEKISRYGIVGGAVVREGVVRVEKVVEKPSLQNAPSRLAIAARYVFTPAIFDCLDRARPAKPGELQLTDAIEMLAAREPVHGVILRGKRHDIGNPIDWLKTNIFFAARDKKIWSEIAPLLKSLMQ